MLDWLSDLYSERNCALMLRVKIVFVSVLLVAVVIAGQNPAEAKSLHSISDKGSTSHAAKLYVSPRGNDHNSGLTPDHPLGSIQAAQELVQQWTSLGMQRDIEVYLEGGIYRITSPLRFGSHDSGENGHKVIWRNYLGESPVISGGTSITGWSKAPIGTTLHPISFGKSPVFLEYTKQYPAANSFWLNTADDKVQWLPEPGVKTNNVRVIAPTTKRLVIIDGASNLIFYGLQFAYTTWLRPAQYGNMERQGGFRAEPHASGFIPSKWPTWYVNPGAVTVKNSSHIIF